MGILGDIFGEFFDVDLQFLLFIFYPKQYFKYSWLLVKIALGVIIFAIIIGLSYKFFNKKKNNTSTKEETIKQ